MIISLGFESPRTSSDLPEDLGRASRSPTFRRKPTGVFLFGLASGDAYRASDVTTTAVGSYPAVSPLPDPQRQDLHLIVLAIGGLFSVVLVSDRSAWELPSALPMKSGLSSRNVTAPSDHPVFSLAQSEYRKGTQRMQVGGPSGSCHPRNNVTYPNTWISAESAMPRPVRPVSSGKPPSPQASTVSVDRL